MTTVSLLFLAAAVDAAPRSWSGATGEWHNVANWDGGVSLPGADDEVTIANAGASVILTGSVSVLSLTLNKTLTFTNWNTCLNVSGDVTIASGGLMTCAGPFTNAPAMSNRVNVVCDNFTVATGGSVNVDAKGYAGGVYGSNMGQGPGGGLTIYYPYEGGTYGGFGALNMPSYEYYFTLGSAPYGDPEAPLAAGSGGGGTFGRTGGAGGGAVRIVASGCVTVNGAVSANGEYAAGPGYAYSNSGSGGGIYIACQRIEGAGGKVQANGGNARNSPAVTGGGGGRVAVHYDSGVQETIPVPDISFAALPGYDADIGGFAVRCGDIGTLWFPDTRFWSSNMALLQGQLLGTNAWTTSELVLTNRWIGFSAEGFALTVSGDVRVEGPYAGLSLGGPQSKNYTGSGQHGNAQYRYGEKYPATLVVGGDVLVTNKARLFVYSATTNEESLVYGARMAVEGTLKVATNSWIYLSSHPTNGGSVKLEVGNLAVDAGGTIHADKGFTGGDGTYVVGYGPGGGRGGAYWEPAGAGYGGDGGGTSLTRGLTYGSSNAPAQPGSGGRGSGKADRASYGKVGGGLIWVEAQNRVDLGGTLSADAQGQGAIGTGGAGSGGGVYLRCRTFAGTSGGAISAQGGSTSSGGGGGGGRIAVWRQRDVSTGMITTSVTNGFGKTVGAAPGTVVWGWIPTPGTLITIR